MSWLLALIGLAVGGLAGYLLARRFGDSEQRAAALQKELDATREKHADYRREVGEHFARTAVAVNRLTESYRDVHRQLSDGAQALCDDTAAKTALAFDQSRLIDAPEPAENVPDPATASATAPEPGPAAAEPPAPATEAAAAAAEDAEPRDDAPAAQDDDAPPTPDDGARTQASEPTDGGASWTPPAPPEPDPAVTAPRDYADEAPRAEVPPRG